MGEWHSAVQSRRRENGSAAYGGPAACWRDAAYD